MSKDEKDKLDVVKVDGTGITKGGEEVKTEFFNWLRQPMDNYDDLEFTVKEAKSIEAKLRRMATGLNAVVPMVCGGADKCPVKDKCPYVQQNKAPLGRDCLVESELVQYLMHSYIKEFEIDTGNISEVALINELVEIDIYTMRTGVLLAKGTAQSFTQFTPVGTNEEGKIVTKKEIHRAFEVRERLSRRKMKILEALVGTRKEKLKEAALNKDGVFTGDAKGLSDMRKKIERFKDRVLETEDILNDAAAKMARPIDPISEE